MSTTSQTWCDRCARQVTEDRTELEVVSGPMRPHRDSIDLCKGCCADLVVWLRSSDLTREPAGPRRLAAARSA